MLRPDVTLPRAYDLGTEAHADRGLLRPLLDELLAALAAGSAAAAAGHARSRSSEAGDAFRFMAQARHVGKLVLRRRRRRDASAAVVAPTPPTGSPAASARSGSRPRAGWSIAARATSC